ncbi:MAG: ATP-binding protein [Alphaproteobacteria bacterium]
MKKQLLSKEVLDFAAICNQQMYHLGDYIQPHCLLLLLDEHDLSIKAASENAAIFFAIPLDELLGKNFTDLLVKESAFALQKFLKAESALQEENRRILSAIALINPAIASEALFFRSGQYIGVEIELNQGKKTSAAVKPLFLHLAKLVHGYQGKQEEFSQFICEALARLTQCERTYFCAFDEEGNGHVQGEYLSGTLPSLLGHHFPHTDIPQIVRPIYVKNRFRMVADVAAPPAKIIGLEKKNIDLTWSFSRKVADTHLQYLKNMGVGASASFSVVRNGQLIALFGCHHTTPLKLSYQLLADCLLLVETFNVRQELLFLEEEHRLYEAREKILAEIVADLRENPADMVGFVSRQKQHLCGLFQADDLLFWHHASAIACSSLSSAINDAQQLASFIADRMSTQQGSVFCSDDLSHCDAALARLSPQVCGVLAVALDYANSSILIFLRKEQRYAEKWSGNPSEAVIRDPSGNVGPRLSFETWKREIEGRCLPWKNFTLKIARKFEYFFHQTMAEYYNQLANIHAKRLNVVVDNVLDGVIAINKKGEIISFNPAAEKIFATPCQQAIGLELENLIPLFKQQGVDDFIGKRQAISACAADGSVFPAEISLNLVETEKELIMVAIIRDQREKYEAEKILQMAKSQVEMAYHSKKEFLSNITQELSLPMHTVLGLVDAALDKQADITSSEKYRQYFYDIRVNSEKMLLMVRDLIDLAHFQSGFMRFHFSMGLIGLPLQQAINDTRNLLEQKSLHLALAMDGAKRRIIFDHAKIQQVFVITLTNAIKFTAKAKKIEVSLKETPQSTYIIEIADQSPPLQESEICTIFEKFQFSQSPRNADNSLSIAQEIILAHKGKIWVQNNRRGGVSFLIELPIIDSLAALNVAAIESGQP